MHEFQLLRRIQLEMLIKNIFLSYDTSIFLHFARLKTVPSYRSNYDNDITYFH